MSEYVCVASNGIPPDESWTIKLLVTCELTTMTSSLFLFPVPPLVLAKETTVRAGLGGMARLVCNTESWPRPEVIWETEGRQVFDSDEFSTVRKG